jgi:hypothetical protein
LRKAAPEPHVSGMKLCAASWLALSLALLPAARAFAPSAVGPADDDEPADAGAPEAEPPPEAGAKPAFPPCIDVRAYARYGAGAYDHIVHIENGCDKDAHCEVATDVSPEVITTTVPAGEGEDLVTFRGSPSTEFHARVKCDLEE